MRLNKYSLIANSGIHFTSTIIEINTKNRFNIWFHEWFNTENGQWILDLVQEVQTETDIFFYKKKDLYDKGYLKEITNLDFDISLLKDDGILPLKINDEMQCPGEIYKMNFTDRSNTLSKFENQWLPVPYFLKNSETKFKFGPFNWSRLKLIPLKHSNSATFRYKVLLAFDTRTSSSAMTSNYNEYPIFPHDFMQHMSFEVCSDDYLLMDFCSPREECEYINNYLFQLVHPELRGVGKIKTGYRLSYIASYYLLITYISQNNLFPTITLYKDHDVPVKEVDMVIDIGNSRTTALLVEDNTNFNQVNQLQLVDYTSILDLDSQEDVSIYQEPFDMRLAFRKVSFGQLGIQDSKQFIYPSLVRLGKEANKLIHRATETDDSQEMLSTLSSPKRYLWDNYKSKEEWKFITLEGESDSHILKIPGISEQLQSDGQLVKDGLAGGISYHYSRRSLMTFAFLEMLVQANTQINGHEYRVDRGGIHLPRKVRRIIVTCPTAMSKIEREALVKCAENAATLFKNFYKSDRKIDIIPAAPSFRDIESKWFYDEATCAQLVYIYGEAGYKYKGSCQEFFNLYGKVEKEGDQAELTIGSLDIGAGTSDLMISKYSYTKSDITTITPDPLFYDSFYYAGDDMLNDLIKSVMFFSPDSAFRKALHQLSEVEYRQKLRDFFGPDHAGQTVADRQLRRDFNMQYSVPLMYYILSLLSKDTKDCMFGFEDVFVDSKPNKRVLNGFYNFFGFKLESLMWEYRGETISNVIAKSFEPLLKKIATIMYSYKCDIVLLSGRPSSLAPIRNIFLKYYSVSPNRLILLNNYFVGHWYPFSNNTGYIANSKTVVAVGALVSYYASTLANLDRFIIDKSKLDTNLKSVINYIEGSREGARINYIITPNQPQGELTLSSLPTTLSVRQLGIDSYPSRKLYVIAFNEYILQRLIKKEYEKKNESITDNKIIAELQNIENKYKLLMPFSIIIERDQDNKENLIISSIRDRNDNELTNNILEINIQSLGADKRYWLDTGAFEIQ